MVSRCYEVSELILKTLILSIESGSICEHQDVSTMFEINLTRLTNSFVENIHFLPNLSYPICHYNSVILSKDPQNFPTLLSSDLIFFQPPVRINMNNLEQIAASAKIQQYTSLEKLDF